MQPVLKALRRGGINIVSVHNQYDQRVTAYRFLHYRGIGPTVELARTIKTAADSPRNGRPVG